MKKLRVLVLVREGLVPPDSIEGLTEEQIDEFRMEYNIVTALEHMGHAWKAVGVYDDLTPLREALNEFKPHIVFMLLEEFHGVVTYDHAVVSFLELMRQKYTGCNPRGLLISHDKGLSKKLLTYHRIPTPRFVVFPLKRAIRLHKKLEYPLLVKSATEDASLGISQSSVVYDEMALIERVQFMHEKVNTDALVEEYIPGRELYLGMLGNHRLQNLPLWEIDFGSIEQDARIATRKVKWDRKYQKKHGITSGLAKDLPPELEAAIIKIGKRVFRALEMSGYVRIDLRLRDDGRIYVLEANANPDLTYGEDFAEAAETAGLKYEELIQRIINLGLSYHAPWQA
ncbi:MAG: ATP-grasp domain-containing protein [Planctomycetales bacterium]|nr:ATP-grasp domain-containing protein [Planctomycetales bacterium]